MSDVFLPESQVLALFDAAYREHSEPRPRLDDYIGWAARMEHRLDYAAKSTFASKGKPEHDEIRDCVIAVSLSQLLFLIKDRQRSFNAVLRKSEPEFVRVLAKALNADISDVADALGKAMHLGGGGY